MANKKLFGGVRKQLVGALVAAVGGIALTACSSGGNCGCAGPAVYKKPCCAGQSSPCSAPCGGCAKGATMTVAPAPAMPAPAAPAAGQKACGAGKCG